MSRTRGIGLLLSVSLALASPEVLAQKKKKKKPAGAEGGSSATEFQPEAKGGSGGGKAAGKAAGGGDGQSKVLDRAIKLYDGEDYYSASIELNKVAEGEAGDNEANKQKAEFWMGKTLYNMKFYSAALSYFDRIVQKGPSHAYYNATLRWLAQLSRLLPDSTGILEKIGKYQRSELDQPALEKARDELYFLLGKFYYTKGQFKEAVSLFTTVPQTSEFYVQAKLFEGATHVREYEAKPAVESFKEVLRVAAESPDPKVKPFEDLANLSLARTFYSTGQFELATKYFDRVSHESVDWPNSLFESSWANFMLKQRGYSKALGNIHTLQAPYFENFIKPESVGEALTVKATIYFYNCLYDRATEAIEEYKAAYEPLEAELRKMVSANPDNTALFELAQKIREGTSGLSENTERSSRAVLSDRSLLKRFEYVDELTREIAQHEKAEPSWKLTTIANNILQDLSLQKGLAVNEAGDLARQRLIRLAGELNQLNKRVIKIDYSILEGEKGTLEKEIQEERQIVAGPTDKRPDEIRVDDEHNFWPFSGEYWRDELGYYRFRVVNKCAQSAPEGAPTGPTE